MQKLMWIVLALAGCDKQLNPAYCAANPKDPLCAAPDAAGTGDTPEDGSICVGAGLYTVCVQAPPIPVTLDEVTIDTDATTDCLKYQPTTWMTNGQPEACFVVGSTVTVQSALQARGTRALVIVATDSITLNAGIDAAGHVANANGIPSGYDEGVCASSSQAPASLASTGGGGAGGTFTSAGGDGGSGDSGASQAGLAAVVGANPTVLRGGCRGQAGANGTGNGGVGGTGGGGVYLVAANTITINAGGYVNVSGGGGHAAAKMNSGGGGGGAGGMIVIHASNVDVASAVMIANGGGGSAGAASTGGLAGADPDPTAPSTPAPGGTGAGGAGGAGFAGTTAAVDGQGTTSGGGAGGGGGGYIQSNVPLTGAIVSPAATVIP